MNTAYVDILMLHMPDEYADPTAVAKFFAESHKQGKAKHFGLSNHKAHRFDLINKKMMAEGLPGLVTHEYEFSVWNPSATNYNNGLTDHSMDLGMRPLAWGPLAGAPLGGPNRLFGSAANSERGAKIVAQLSQVAEELGMEKTDADIVALAWILSHPVGAIPILGTTKIERMIRQTTKALSAPKLTPKQWYDIANAGGICALADIACAYTTYLPR